MRCCTVCHGKGGDQEGAGCEACGNTGFEECRIAKLGKTWCPVCHGTVNRISRDEDDMKCHNCNGTGLVEK